MGTPASADSMGMEGGGGMEHMEDGITPPPLVSPRLLMQFCNAVQQYAATVGRSDEASRKVKQLKGKLQNLRDLASLSRLAVLGHPGSFRRVLDEMQCIAVDFPSDPLMDQDCMAEEEDEPDDRTNFAAVIDLLVGA